MTVVRMRRSWFWFLFTNFLRRPGLTDSRNDSGPHECVMPVFSLLAVVAVGGKRKRSQGAVLAPLIDC